jgi:chromosomal replication initiation ATPase DnaA
MNPEGQVGEPDRHHALLCQAADVFEVTVADLTGPRRTPDLVQARFAAAYALRRHCQDMPLRAIGAALGGRDHSTIIKALRRAETLAQRDTDYNAKLQALVGEPSAPVTHSLPAPIALLGRPWWLQSNTAG